MDNSAASSDAFTHEPLPDPAKYMRLLEVLNDNYSDDIKVRCTLTTWPIDSVPSYHAISYTWGDPESNVFILLNDKALKVRTNCEFALKQAYWYRKTRPYWQRRTRFYCWIDSVCIDQANLREKSQQVSMMGSIYKNACHVLACIGDHFEDSLFFFKKLHGLKRRVVPMSALFRDTACPKCWSVSTRFRLVHRYSTTTRFVIALAHLATRPYFSRLWILQELHHAQSITILCGKDILRKDDAISLFNAVSYAYKEYDNERPWQYFEKTPFCYQDFVNEKFYRRSVNHGVPHPMLYGDWLRGVRRRSKVTCDMLRKDTVESISIFWFCYTIVCQLECAEPRDKVYGIISMIEWGDVAAPLPNYTQSDFKVAIEFLEAIAKLQKTREHDESLWHCIIIVIKMLNLDIGSRGLDDALQARRGPPHDFTTKPAEVRGEDFTTRIREPFRRLLNEDIESNESKLRNLQSSPSAYPDGCTFLLPQCAKAGDCAISLDPTLAKKWWYRDFDQLNIKKPPYTPILIMREGQGPERDQNMLIGYGFYASRNRTPSFMERSRAYVDSEFDKEQAYIDLNFSIEDGIIYLLKIKQLNELPEESTEWMAEFLETGVCRRQSPGSSYGTLPSDI